MTGPRTRTARRLRIAYLAHGVGGAETGVHAKILTQARTWAELDRGVEVGVFVRCEAGSEADWRGRPNVVAVTSSRLGLIGRFGAREQLSLQVARWRPTAIYLRQSTVSPSVLALMLGIPTIVELNTLDLAELRVQAPLRYWYARLVRDMALGRAKGLVAVTRQIADHSSVTRLGRPVAVIPNGVQLDQLPTVPAPRAAGTRLLFIGTPGHPWHGLDKIMRLAVHRPAWEFDIVGPSREALPGAPPNVTVHGPQSRETLGQFAATADVAIGPLAFHRIGLVEASPLKVGDYLAFGLPTITAYVDTRFPRGAPFLLTLPNVEDNVERCLAEIETFATAWKGRRVERADIAAIDVRTLEGKRLSLLRDLARTDSRPAGDAGGR